MPFARPNLTELRDRTGQDLVSGLGVDALLPRSIERILADVLALLAHGLYGFLDYLARQLFPNTADAANLEQWAQVWGLSRKQAVAAQGEVEFTGQDQATIPAGTVVSGPGGLEYATTAELVLVEEDPSGGRGTVTVQATAAGASSNLPAATVLELVQPVSGVNSTGAVQSGGIVGGVDTEDDDDLRARLLERIQDPPKGGAAADYELWALEVAGVTRAWVYPQWGGPGTVGVTFVLDDDPLSVIPNTVKLAEVQAYLDERRPVTAAVTAFAPVAAPVQFEISLTPNLPEVQAEVEQALRDLLEREAEPGQGIAEAAIVEAIATAPGEQGHQILAPVGGIQVDDGELATFGGVTWL